MLDERIKVCVDVDETICASLRAFLRHIGQEERYELIKSYDLSETIGEENRQLYLEFIKNMSEEIEDYCVIWEFINHKGSMEFEIVSTRSNEEKAAFEETHKDWFEDPSSLYNLCNCIVDKSCAKGDVLIDDWPKEEFTKNFRYVIVIDRPWNRGKYLNFYRVKSVKEAIELIRKMIASGKFVTKKV